MANCSSSHRDEEEIEGFMEQLETAMKSPSFIFKLPESIRRANPDAFLPRQIALGPQNPKNKFEFYKLEIANKIRSDFHLPEIEQLCTQIEPFKFRILACYDFHFEIDAHNFARVLLVDSLFLLRLLLNFSDQIRNSASIEFTLPNFDAQINQEWLLNDVVKMENQIPLLVFQRILLQHLQVNFPVLLYCFCQSISPFALDSFRKPNVVVKIIDPNAHISDLAAILNQSHHLLHFMYLSILIFPCTSRRWLKLQGAFNDSDSPALTFIQKWISRLEMESVLELILYAIELIGLTQKLVELIRKFVTYKTKSSHVIPSASQLLKLSFDFESTAKGILETSFEIQDPDSTPLLTIPFININAYTETLFENLLAFESMANMNPPVFSLYLELMSALIRTPADVRILGRKRIIKCHLDNGDVEVVKMFKRLGNTISNLENPEIYKNLQPVRCSFEKINMYDEVYKGMVKKINKYYHGFLRVKATIFWNKFVICVWRMLGVLLILSQIFVLVKKGVRSFVGNDEPDYEQIRAT